MSGTREWDAGTYDRVSAPQLAWGRELIERLELTGDETVLDAGCGSGRVSELLVAALPNGRLTGADGSRAMLTQARERLGSEVELIHSDLLELHLTEPVDAVFSSATFHWIGDHPALFARAFEWLTPGGRLEAQCGGEGNIASFLAVVAGVEAEPRFAPYLGDRPRAHNFAGPEETQERLLSAGFERVRCWSKERPERPPEPRAFIESVCLGAHLSALPQELKGPFVDAVYEAWGPERELDYVRLNISARRPADA